MTITRKEYKDELTALKKRMEKAEAHAKKLPIFADVILERKLTGEEAYQRYADTYKGVYFAWGINRGYWSKHNGRDLGYSGEKYEGYLFCIYVNTISMYGSHSEFGLEEIANKIPLVKFDPMNSKFYATDDQITALLDALKDWYDRAIVEVKKYNDTERRKKLEAELSDLNKDITNDQ